MYECISISLSQAQVLVQQAARDSREELLSTSGGGGGEGCSDSM